MTRDAKKAQERLRTGLNTIRGFYNQSEAGERDGPGSRSRPPSPGTGWGRPESLGPREEPGVENRFYSKHRAICGLQSQFEIPGMATHSSILSWRIPWTEEPGGLQSTDRKESDTRTPLSSRVATRVSWSPLSGLKGVQPPLPFGTIG